MNLLKSKFTGPGLRLLVAGGLCLGTLLSASTPALPQGLADEGTVLAYMIEMYRRTGRDCQEARKGNIPELTVSEQLRQAIPSIEGGKDVKTALSEQGLVSNANTIFTVSGNTPRQAFSTLRDQNCAGLLGNYNQIAAVNSGGRWTVIMADARQAPVNAEPQTLPDQEPSSGQPLGQPGEQPLSLSPKQNNMLAAATPGPASVFSDSSGSPKPTPESAGAKEHDSGKLLARVSPSELKAAPPDASVNWHVRDDNAGGASAAVPPGTSEDGAPRRLPRGYSPSEFEAANPDPSVNWRITEGNTEAINPNPVVILPPGTVIAPSGVVEVPPVAAPTPGGVFATTIITVNPDLDQPQSPPPPSGTVYEVRDGSRVIVTNQYPAQPVSPTNWRVQPVTLSGEALLAFELINQARASGRLCGSRQMPPAPPLVLDPALTRSSQKHAQDMARNNYFSERSLSGKLADQRISEEGFMWASIGENIARGPSNAQLLVQGWLYAPRNCENIMSGNFDRAGIDFEPGSAIWVLDLAKALR